MALDGGFLKDDVRDTVGEGLPVDGLSFEEIATGCVEDPVGMLFDDSSIYLLIIPTALGKWWMMITRWKVIQILF